MTSRERLLGALTGRKTDRVPISTYEMVARNHWPQTEQEQHAYDVLGCDFKAWYHRQPSYRGLLDYLERNTDCLYMWFPDEVSGSGKFLNGHDCPKDVHTETRGNSIITRTVLHTPKGDLSSATRVDKGINTVWEIEHLLKDVDDIDKLLSIPYAPYRPDTSSYQVIQQQLGEHGLMLPNLGDAVLYVAELFGFTEFTVNVLTERERMRALLAVMQERVLDQLDYLLESGCAGCHRIVGPEYCAEPFLPTRDFVEFVAIPDAELVSRLHQGGALARLHCHGRVKNLLPIIRDMGVDALDPVEAFPSGDLTLAEAKKAIGDRVTLLGNMQLRDLEQLPQAEIVALTRRMLEQGMDGGRFILMPTAAPINEPISEVTERNYRAFVDTALRYGAY